MADLASKSLGQISGLCACYNKATLNGRPYAKIYKDILEGQNYRFNEMMRRGGILCEFGHPSQFTADFERTETDPEKAAAILTKIEEGEEGKVYAEGYILDTPAGRTYKAISPFYNFGFSSRGSYEASENDSEGPDGWNQESYLFKGFDIVILPATEESEVSAAESVKKAGRPKKRKSARESLDLNNIADAQEIDKEEVERELDKLFDENGNLAPVEYVDSRDFAKEMAEVEANNPNNKEAGKEPSSILLDLHKVLTEKSTLEKQVQKLLFEKAESDSAIISLRDQIAQISGIKEEAEQKLLAHETANGEIQQLVNRLLETYGNYTNETQNQLVQTTQRADMAEKTIKSLASRAAELESSSDSLENENNELQENLDAAQEQIKEINGKLREAKSKNSNLIATTEQLQKKVSEMESAATKKNVELKSAREAVVEYRKNLIKANNSVVAAREHLMDTYSDIYSISKEALRREINPRTATAQKIRAAAEQLSTDTLRLASYLQGGASQAKEVSAPKKKYGDEIEEELFRALDVEGYTGGKSE